MMGRAYKRGAVWWIDYTDADGRRQRKPTKERTKGGAEKLLAEVVVREERVRLGFEQRDRNPERLTFAEACEWWLEKVSPTTKAHEKNVAYVRKLTASPLGPLPIERVTTATVSSWLLDLERDGLTVKGTPYSALTLNHIRSFVSRIYSALIEHGKFLGENPALKVKKRAVEVKDPRAIPAAVIKPLIGAVVESWRPLVAVAAYAGLRRSEIFALRKADVDLDAGIIRVRAGKTGRERTVAIHPELRPYLVQALDNDSPLAFPAPGGGAWSGDSKSSSRVKAALRRLGLELEGVDACFHALRHSFVTQLAEGGAPESVARWMAWGTRSTDMLNRYMHLTPEALHRAIAVINYPDSEGGKVIPLASRRTS